MWRLIFLLLFPFSLSAQLKRFEFSESKMGSSFNLIFYHTDSVEAISIAQNCFQLIDSLNNIFSDYSVESEVGKLTLQSTNHPIKISEELFKMISQSQEAWKKSHNSFDITMGEITQLWRKSRFEKSFPSHREIRKAKKSSGFDKIQINISDRTIIFKNPGIRFDFGGIVKGYAAQRIIDFLKTKNITHALADAGGDIAMSNAPPGKTGWNIGINLPEQENELWEKKLELQNCAVATSGDVYRYTIHKGKKYSHIIDPRTGYGVITQRNVTVIAKDGTTADWLATACSILPIKKAMLLAKKENAALMIATLKNNKTNIYKSENFDQYFQKKEP